MVTNLSLHITELEKKYGGLRRTARLLSIDPAYLWRLKKGQKNPSEFTLRKLGLRRRVIYEEAP